MAIAVTTVPISRSTRLHGWRHFANPLLRLLSVTRELRRFQPHVIQSAHFYVNLYAALAGIEREMVCQTCHEHLFARTQCFVQIGLVESGHPFMPMCVACDVMARFMDGAYLSRVVVRPLPGQGCRPNHREPAGHVIACLYFEQLLGVLEFQVSPIFGT